MTRERKPLQFLYVPSKQSLPRDRVEHVKQQVISLLLKKIALKQP